jgi:hypothetical protein
MFGSVAAHDQDGIGILDVDPVIGHCAASKRLSQSRNSGAVSDSGLMVHMDDAEAARGLMGQGAFLVVGMRCAEKKHGVKSIDGVALLVFEQQTGVSCLFHPFGDLIQGPIQLFSSHLSEYGAR